MAVRRYYTNEKNLLVILALLKSHNIKKVVTSPGSTNHTLVASMQNDSWFELYSSVDERSAAYMACGLCAESSEPVVITCTEATASRNYMPGMTEAYYRKLPILAIATTHGADKVGHHVAQVLDHTVLPNDMAVYNTILPVCNSSKEVEKATLIVNEAILALSYHGGGPVYLCAETLASRDYSVKELPDIRAIHRVTYADIYPKLPEGRIGIFVGSHKMWKEEEIQAIDCFCATNNAVVFCDHTSSYTGKYKVNYSLIGGQDQYVSELGKLRLLIHIGEVSGDYFSGCLGGNAGEVWRVSEDGVLRDHWGKLRYIFEMKEKTFFNHYSEGKVPVVDHVLPQYKKEYSHLLANMPELPLSKVWIASQVASKLPIHSTIHFSILGSLRAFNFFELPDGVKSNCNVGGFGIDGATSTLLGASLADKGNIHFLMTGDLALFYDLNAIGNRHLGKNVRILLVNNGDGTEFRMYWHPISAFSKEEADKYMAAGGHYGSKSHSLMKHMSEDLGFEYLTASTKEEFTYNSERFLSTEPCDKPMLFEVFTNSEDDDFAVHAARNLVVDKSMVLKREIKEKISSVMGDSMKEVIKNFFK